MGPFGWLGAHPPNARNMFEHAIDGMKASFSSLKGSPRDLWVIFAIKLIERCGCSAPTVDPASVHPCLRNYKRKMIRRGNSHSLERAP